MLNKLYKSGIMGLVHISAKARQRYKHLYIQLCYYPIQAHPQMLYSSRVSERRDMYHHIAAGLQDRKPTGILEN